MCSSKKNIPLQKLAKKRPFTVAKLFFFFLFAHLNDVWFGIVRT